MNLLQVAKEEHGELVSTIPIWLFNITLGIGTLLLILGLAFGDCETLMMVGFFYTIISFALNAIAFVSLMVLSFVFTNHSNEIRLNTMLMLINIPVAILYAYLILSGISLFE